MNNVVHHIFKLNEDKSFSEDQAYNLVNLFLPVTSKAKNKINGLNSRLEIFRSQVEMSDEIQYELNLEISKWSEKIRRLGGIPLSLYKVKIPSENGYFVWEFPSVELVYNS